MTPCPKCRGKKTVFIPSDGYENSSSGPCQPCNGIGTKEAYEEILLGKIRKIEETQEHLRQKYKALVMELAYSQDVVTS